MIFLCAKTNPSSSWLIRSGHGPPRKKLVLGGGGTNSLKLLFEFYSSALTSVSPAKNGKQVSRIKKAVLKIRLNEEEEGFFPPQQLLLVFNLFSNDTCGISFSYSTLYTTHSFPSFFPRKDGGISGKSQTLTHRFLAHFLFNGPFAPSLSGFCAKLKCVRVRVREMWSRAEHTLDAFLSCVTQLRIRRERAHAARANGQHDSPISKMFNNCKTFFLKKYFVDSHMLKKVKNYFFKNRRILPMEREGGRCPSPLLSPLLFPR